MNDLGKKFFNIKKSGISDGQSWTQETEAYLVKEVLKEGVKRHFLKILQNSMQKRHKSDSTEVGLHATPISWKQKFPDHPLNTLEPMTISILDHQGYAIESDIFYKVKD